MMKNPSQGSFFGVGDKRGWERRQGTSTGQGDELAGKSEQ